MENTKIFVTSDTSMAAFLSISGYNPEMKPPEDGNESFVFIFEKNEMLEHLVHLMNTGKAEGNIINFFREYRRLVRVIKSNGVG